MAVIKLTATPLDYAYLYAWDGLANGDTGEPLESGAFGDRCLQVAADGPSGAFGVGGTLVWEGSNNGTTWFTLTDPQGNAMSFTTARMEQVLENPRYMRPNVTGGDGTTRLFVSLYLRRSLK